MATFTLRPLYPLGTPPVPTEWQVEWDQNRSRPFEEEENHLLLPNIKNSFDAHPVA